jgi:hypothetical protein
MVTGLPRTVLCDRTWASLETHLRTASGKLQTAETVVFSSPFCSGYFSWQPITMYWIMHSLVLLLLLERSVNWLQLSGTFTKINGFFYNMKRTSAFWYKQPSLSLYLDMCQIRSQAWSINGCQGAKVAFHLQAYALVCHSISVSLTNMTCGSFHLQTFSMIPIQGCFLLWDDPVST